MLATLKLNKLYLIPVGVFFIGLFWSCENKSVEINSSNNLTVKSNEDSLIDIGKKIAKKTFETLSSQLNRQIEEHGIEGAIKYCSVAAIPLTDSISKLYNVSIKRAAKSYRNKANTQNEEEELIFDEYSKILATNAELKPKLAINKTGKTVFYAPIILQPMCVSCHGTKEQIGNNYNLISSIYPEDRAINFAPNDLRGIWSITFN